MKPFSVHVPEEVLVDLRERLKRTRWPDEVEGAAWKYGTNLGYLRELVDYWISDYDWRAHEAALNRIPQFLADVDGASIHFAHVRGKGPKPAPLVITHGWPSSGFEMWDIIGPLADPAAHGGDARDAFDVVIPTMPGYGFSAPILRSGFPRVDNLWRRLMEMLGYRSFFAHGVDVGARVTSALGRFHRGALIGIHIGSVDLDWPDPLPDASTLSQVERDYLARCDKWEARDGAYSAIQATRPQTLAYGLTDSPVGLAAWIVEKFREWSDCGGDVEKRFSKDQLLDNVTLYWATGTLNSSIRRYYEARYGGRPKGLPPGERIETPTGIAMFPGEKDLLVPREFAERSYNIVHWTDPPRGGHFPAVEEPELLVRDIREFARSLR